MTRGAVASALRARFGQRPRSITLLDEGQSTDNYRVGCWDGAVRFAKSYPSHADLDMEREAIAKSQLAGSQGVPVAPCIPSTSGDAIATHRGVSISLWGWVEGSIEHHGMSPGQREEAGRALGLIHRSLSPGPRGCERWEPPIWMEPDYKGLIATAQRVRAAIPDPDRSGWFDHEARRTIATVERDLDVAQDLLAGMGELTYQRIHGDYTPMNLMFQGDALAAVVDFRERGPKPIAHELGGIAYDPRELCCSDDWQEGALDVVRAYLEVNPDVPADAVEWSARSLLVRMLTSLFGVEDHYLNPSRLQDDLDRFWLLRHRASEVLAEALPDVERDLRSLIKGLTRVR